MRHLLCHSSGLANPLPLRWVHPATEAGPIRGEFVRRLIERHRRLRFDPGTRAAYSNLGYLVLGEIIETVSGETFEEFIQHRILDPLDMTHTGFTADPASDWATPYQRRHTPLGVLLPVLLPRKLIGPAAGPYRSLHHFYVDGAAYGGLRSGTVPPSPHRRRHPERHPDPFNRFGPSNATHRLRPPRHRRSPTAGVPMNLTDRLRSIARPAPIRAITIATDTSRTEPTHG